MQKQIDDFKKRIEVDGLDFCKQLFRDAEIRVLAAKYAYYINNAPILSDLAYDGTEVSWYIMGRALGHLKEDETSPCIDWNEKHSLAKEAIELCNKLKPMTNY